MKKLLQLSIAALCLAMSFGLVAQPGERGAVAEDILPDAIYEIRYWTNMAAMGDQSVYIDTMIFFGNERAVFEYSNSNCLSYHCRESDSLVYVLMPKFIGAEKEWVLGENYVRKLHRVTVPYRGRDRVIYKVFSTNVDHRDSGIGEYVLVSREFGILYRYNSDGEQFMLNHVDIMRNGKTVDELDLLPLHMALGQTDIFNGYSE